MNKEDQAKQDAKEAKAEAKAQAKEDAKKPEANHIGEQFIKSKEPVEPIK
jgi:hypothetical protein